MATNKQAAEFIKTVYTHAWQKYSYKGFCQYYDKNMVAQTDNKTFDLDMLHQLIADNHALLGHMRAIFHNVIATDKDRFTAWFTNIHFNKNQTEAFRVKTMASYRIKDDKIIHVDFMWDKPIDFVMCQGRYSYRALSPKQTQCFFYVIQGYTAKQIAQAMKISNRTVETHIIAIKTKLHLSNTKEMIEYAIANNLINLSPLLSNLTIQADHHG